MHKAQLARRFWSILLAPTFLMAQVGTAILAISTQGAIASPVSADALAAAPELRSWEFDPYTNELQITVPDGTIPEYFLLQQPLRIVIDIPNSEIGANPTEENYQGIVRQIRVGQFETGVARIVMELAPGIAIQPEQIQLEPIGQANRWVLRPSLNLSETLPNAESAPTPSPATDTTAQTGFRTLPALPPTVGNQPPEVFVPPPPPPALEDYEIRETLPSNEPAIANQSETESDDSESSEFELPSEQTRPSDRTPTVSVPSLENASEIASDPPPPPPSFEIAEFELPSESSGEGDRPATVTVPTVETIPEAQDIPIQIVDATAAIAEEQTPVSTPTAPIAIAVKPVIEFGEPLPESGAIPVQPLNGGDRRSALANSSTPTAVETAANLPADVLLSAGTVLILSYPGTAPLILDGGSPRQEVLLVYSEVYDRTGKLMAEVGTPVIGRFVSDRKGTRFVAQSIILQGRAVPLTAESDPLEGQRDISQRKMISYSAIGAVAGAVLGGIAGGPLLGGAAAGAATTLLSSPKTAIIQPGQVLPVRLTEHWR